MAKSIFISHNYNDIKVSQAVKKMINDNKERIDNKLVFVDHDDTQSGSAAMDWEIVDVMAGCDAVLFVTGDHHRSSPFIHQEVHHAIEKNLPMLATSLPGEGFHIPRAINKEDCAVFNWGSGELYNHMNQI
ncbi:MAG: TIR domain-containing protein [Algicola sp.]|nr:TIR domain-containing protein [Algicola sp.]